MSIIDKNQPNWFGNAGEPLKSGYIYIGQPNQPPVEFPKNVTFTDSSGSAFTATQPLRTNSEGQIVWNGKAITASTDGDYSMLVLDSTQTQINGGYVPFVEGEATITVDLSVYRQYSLLLVDVKKLDVSPAETVGTVGRAATLDGLGADWLVVSATGSPADDVNLIDFDNGLQGQRIRNNLQPYDNLDNLDDNAVARDNIDVYSKAEALEDAPDTISNSNVPDGELGSEKFQTGSEERDWVLSRTADASVGVVGSYAFCICLLTTGFAPGSTVAGANLRYTNVNGSTVATAISGTWRAMGYCESGSSTPGRTITWLRIS